MFIKHHRGYAVTDQDIGTGQTGRTGTNHRDLFSGRTDSGEIRFPAHLKGFIGDVTFNIADSDRAEFVMQGAGTLAQPVLRTHPAAHFRQAVGLV